MTLKFGTLLFFTISLVRLLDTLKYFLLKVFADFKMHFRDYIHVAKIVIKVNHTECEKLKYFYAKILRAFSLAEKSTSFTKISVL